MGIRKLFSRRQGLEKPETPQCERMSEKLRVGLWNSLDVVWIKRKIDVTTQMMGRGDPFIKQPLRTMVYHLWSDLFNKPVDSIPYDWREVYDLIRDWFFQAEWNEVYDFLEFISPWTDKVETGLYGVFTKVCNSQLARHNASYRLTAHMITPITNEVEASGVGLAMQSPWAEVNTQMGTAIRNLSDRHNPDYRNASKDAINALESTVRLLADDEKATLPKALKSIDQKLDLHPALRTAMEKLYGYASDACGIRHGLVGNDKLGADDARFMVVICSALINHLRSLATRA